jgi:dCMP deaminase
VIEQAELTKLTGEILMPDEEVSRKLANTDLSGCQIKFESIWLRWDRSNITGPKIIQPDLNWQIQQLTQTKTITNDPDQQWLIQAASEAVKSADWWRQVGVVVVKAGKLLLKANNHHLPAEQQAYVDGDPRAEFHQGEAIELTTAIHAEADLIAQAAKQGLALKDATMFVTTFPCPYCAKLIARSGIKKLIYQTGYSMLQGEEVLKSAGVELIQLS